MHLVIGVAFTGKGGVCDSLVIALAVSLFCSPEANAYLGEGRVLIFPSILYLLNPRKHLLRNESLSTEQKEVQLPGAHGGERNLIRDGRTKVNPQQ